MGLKVLALCGFTQNSHIYSKQLGAIRKTCKDVEFVFLEPPHIVEKVDMPWAAQDLNEYDSTATTEKEEQTPETTPRAWWLSSKDRTVYTKYDETVAYLHDALLKQGPFDGIMGFSQGACMAAILCALVQTPNLHPLFPQSPQISPFRFLISVGGFLPQPTSPSFKGYFPLPGTLPTLHVIGMNDTLVTEERSRTLIEMCENKRVEFHEGGHFTPSKASWRHFFHAYIASFQEGGSCGDIPPPATFGPSGKNTPSHTTGGNNTPAHSRPASPPPTTAAHDETK